MPAVLKGALWAGKHVLGVWEGCLQHVLCRYYRWGGRAVCKGGKQPAASPGPPRSSPPLSLPSLRGHHWIRNCFATGIGEAIKRASWDTISALKDGKTTSGKQVWEPRERFLPSCVLWVGRNVFLNSFEFSSLVFGLSPIPSQAAFWQKTNEALGTDTLHKSCSHLAPHGQTPAGGRSLWSPPRPFQTGPEGFAHQSRNPRPGPAAALAARVS